MQKLAEAWTEASGSDVLLHWLRQLLSDLNFYLSTKQRLHLHLSAEPPKDSLLYSLGNNSVAVPPNQTPMVMKGKIQANQTQSTPLKKVDLHTAPEDTLNQAFLLSSSPVCNFKPTIVLKRNEYLFADDPTIKTTESLVYTCAPVEPMFPILAFNSWNEPLRYSKVQTPASLSDSLQQFLIALLNGAAPSDYQIHMVASFGFSSGQLELVDHFCQIPVDFGDTIEKDAAWASAVTTEIIKRWNSKMGSTSPNGSIPILPLTVSTEKGASVWLQLRIQVNQKNAPQRMLVEIDQLSFDLLPEKINPNEPLDSKKTSMRRGRKRP
jgi:hypothetical protein